MCRQRSQKWFLHFRQHMCAQPPVFWILMKQTGQGCVFHARYSPDRLHLGCSLGPFLRTFTLQCGQFVVSLQNYFPGSLIKCLSHCEFAHRWTSSAWFRYPFITASLNRPCSSGRRNTANSSGAKVLGHPGHLIVFLSAMYCCLISVIPQLPRHG